MVQDLHANLRDPAKDPLRDATPPVDDLDARRARSAIAASLFGEPDVPADKVTVGRYEVVDRIGAGGMGVVYRAHDPDLDRDVAVKVLNREGVREGTQADTAQARLVREARAMARLSHPNVIAVYDVGTVDDGVFIAMELVEGRDLASWLTVTRRSTTEILRVCMQAGAGLAAAHDAGVVHRDFKPENVLVGDDGRVRVVDFGLAGGLTAARTLEDVPPEEVAALDEDTSLTRTGAILGTPKYMAPEQYEAANQTTAAGDQFSFCVTLYEGLFRRAPFEGDTIFQYRENVMGGNVVAPPAEHDVPKLVLDALSRGLRVDPTQRFESVQALLMALAPATLDRVRGRKRRVAASLVAVAAVALASVALGRWLGDGDKNEEVAAATVPLPPAADPKPDLTEAPPPKQPEADTEPPAPETPPPGETTPPPAPDKRPAVVASYAHKVCYYEEDNRKFLGPRRAHRKFRNLGPKGTCYQCSRKAPGGDRSTLTNAEQCRTLYYCFETSETSCPD